MTAPVFAHHSFTAEFDIRQPVTLTGVVKQVDWINPHVQMYMDVTDENAHVTTWQIESWSPGLIHLIGLKKEKLSMGTSIKIYAFRAKDGTRNFAYLRHIWLPDGTDFLLLSDNIPGE